MQNKSHQFSTVFRFLIKSTTANPGFTNNTLARACCYSR